MGALCLVLLVLLFGTLCPSRFAIILQKNEGRAGCFALTVFLILQNRRRESWLLCFNWLPDLEKEEKRELVVCLNCLPDLEKEEKRESWFLCLNCLPDLEKEKKRELVALL